MKIDHGGSHVTVLLVTDDFGTEFNLSDPEFRPMTCLRSYSAFDQAKLYVHGFTFEQMAYRTIYPVREEH